MTIKSWHCTDCGLDYEGASCICACGAIASRAGIREILKEGRMYVDTQRGKSRNIDKIIGQQLDQRGITNFSNSGGQNKVTYQDDFTQGACTPAWGKSELNKVLSERYGTSIAAPTVNPVMTSGPLDPFQRAGVAAPVVQGNVAWQPNAGHRPDTLLRQTTVVARTDNKGNQIK